MTSQLLLITPIAVGTAGNDGGSASFSAGTVSIAVSSVPIAVGTTTSVLLVASRNLQLALLR